MFGQYFMFFQVLYLNFLSDQNVILIYFINKKNLYIFDKLQTTSLSFNCELNCVGGKPMVFGKLKG